MNFITSMTMVDRIIGSAPFVYEGDFVEGVRQAEQLGYDQLYFSTVFHRITGEYPKHYRERLEQRAKDGQA